MSAVRRNYSSPPTHGSVLVAKVLQTPALRQQWADELTAMRERIEVMRQRLYDGVVAKLPGRDVRYFIDQRGMFSYTGVSPSRPKRCAPSMACTCCARAACARPA